MVELRRPRRGKRRSRSPAPAIDGVVPPIGDTGFVRWMGRSVDTAAGRAVAFLFQRRNTPEKTPKALSDKGVDMTTITRRIAAGLTLAAAPR